MPRPTKRNQTTEKAVCKALENGMTYTLAAKAAGIALSTLKDWIKKGDEGDEEFVAFSLACHKAEVVGVEKSLKVIKTSKDWRSHAWLLEHRWPEEYGARSHVTVASDEAKPIAVHTINVLMPVVTPPVPEQKEESE